MKKSKGFTLIELLAVIVIVGILITLVSIGVARYVKTSKEKVKVQAAEEIIEIAKAYMATNNVTKVKVGDLILEGYLAKDATNPVTGKNDLISSNDFYVIECTGCTKEKSVSGIGYSDDKMFLSTNDSNNEIIKNVDSIDNTSIEDVCSSVSENKKIKWAKEAVDYIKKTSYTVISLGSVDNKTNFINPSDCKTMDKSDILPPTIEKFGEKNEKFPEKKEETSDRGYSYKYDFGDYIYYFN